MTLIAPSTLIALQSYTQPKQAAAPKSGETFTPRDPGAEDTVQNRDTGGVSVKLSPQAALHLGELTGPAEEQQAQQSAAVTGEAQPRREGQSSVPPAPPGSRLDIEI